MKLLNTDDFFGDAGPKLISLHFRGEYACLEDEFIREYLSRSVVHTRYTFTIGIVFYFLFGILDILLVPDQRHALWLIRFGFVIPFLCLTIILTFFEPFKRFIEALGTAALLVAGSGISVMIALAEPPANYSYYTGLILVLMLGYGMVRIRFKWAAFAGWANVVIYEVIAVFIVGKPRTVLINNNFFFISANIIGMLSCHAMEHYIRKNFIYSRLLKAEKENVNSLNRNLERRVDERTEQLRHQAYHDDLTGLPNRVLFEDRLTQFIHYAEREKKTLAVLFLDIDNFKMVNDSLGHNTGDAYLKIISRRLNTVCREEDTVARLGGDEFVILLPNMHEHRRVIDVIQRIQDKLGDPLSFEDHEIIPSVSIGITFYPDDGNNSQILMKNADLAMYKSKQKGKNTYSFYNRDMSILFRKRIEMEGRLKKALINNEIRIAYQPKVNCSSLQVEGFEALMRWDSPDLGMVPPQDFIGIAEENGVILELGDRVLEIALEDIKTFQAVSGKEMEMAVNLSARQFRDHRLVDRIKDILKKSNVPPGLVNLEITENIVMENSDMVLDILEDLYGLGVKISIDDFGTGYSSYSYLTRFRTNCLKIDKSFVDELTTDNTTNAVVRNIIDLAHTLNMEVVAEGVEREDQFRVLQDAGCELIQGYYFSRPLFKENVLLFLKECSESFS